MAKKIAIGVQDYAKLIENDDFYIDKTGFIREWWESHDAVTLITRPRRFGKTLNMSMLDYFFSNKHAGRADLFNGLNVWKDEKYHGLQGTYPVIFLSFADIKFADFETARLSINGLLTNLYSGFRDVINDSMFSEQDRDRFNSVNDTMGVAISARSVNNLCNWLSRYYGKKCIVLMDEYDTPMQEAYVYGYWDEMAAFMRPLFNSTFKTNPFLDRAVLTGITRVSRESIFSDLNNLNIVTTSSDEYATCFGFTEDEVFAAMDAQGIDPAEKENVKFWYDGFTFGKVSDIYNPWSVTLYLDKGKLGTHWANTSGNGLVGKLIQEGETELKTEFEKLLKGEAIDASIDEEIVFSELQGNRDAVWSLLLASGYLKVVNAVFKSDGSSHYKLALTNFEVKLMFQKMIKRWFSKGSYFGLFMSAMLKGDEKAMNAYMREVTINTFSCFDTGGKDGTTHPERFYHGFVLGLIADKSDSYIVKSNRESGFGRYDVVMEPKDVKDTAIIMEFKVKDRTDGEESLKDTAERALEQIEDKKYDTDLLQRGIPLERIFKYGFAFEGEECLIVKAL
ncbi:MAG: AAA family ATPase [Lachnospiraceae bacterium]|nr:AAA family ATPase [Lachnospiraceae bacterium]